MSNEVQAREREFFDRAWTATPLRRIEEKLEIPDIGSLHGKRILICSCGSGEEPVKAANAGAEVHAFDISSTAVEKAREVAQHNQVQVNAEVMDFHALGYPDDFFDVIYGTAILHHIDCAVAGREIYRCLKPGGVAFFEENSDANPLLRWARRAMFGEPGGFQKDRFLFFSRQGTNDEYPLTREEVDQLRAIFEGNVEVTYPRFSFLELLALHGYRRNWSIRLMQRADDLVVTVLPFVRPYSFLQNVRMWKA